MRRLTALLGKEVRQHAVTGGALIVCLAGLYALLLAIDWRTPDTVSLMQVHAGFLTWVVFGGLVLGNRLVVAEYYGRSQLFVEALPIARFEMLAVKYVLGLTLLMLAAALSLLMTALISTTREAIDWRFLGIVAARSGSLVFCVWSFFFSMGLVGRFRVAIYLGILLALVFLDGFTAFEILRFGPLAVLDNSTLPFEREVLPGRAILHTLALGAGWTAVGFGLALIHEGSVAETLARRMSLREKAIIAILFIALALAYGVIDERRDKPPYTFPDEEVVASATVPLEVLYLAPEWRADAEALLAWLEDDLGRLSRTLGWPTLDGKVLPEVRIACSPSLDAGLYDTAELEENDGILIRANFAAREGWDRRDFGAYVIGRVLDGATDDRARFEPKAWLRDGFAQWWSHRGTKREGGADGDLDETCTDQPSGLLRALWTTRHEPVDASRLERWLLYRERHGEDLAAAVAFSGLLILEQQEGREAVLALARQVFGRRPSRDVRELVYEWRHPMPEVFEQATGRGWPEFINAWNGELDRLRAAPPCQTRLAAIPDGDGTLETLPGEGTIRDVVYGFRFAEPLPEGTLTTLLHRRLSAFDAEIERHDLLQIERLWPPETRQVSWRLPGLYRQHGRAFLALEIESEVLGCPLRFAARRQSFP